MRLATTKHTNSSSRQTISRIFITLPAEIPAISTGVLSCISRGIYSALLQEDPDAFPLLPEKTLYILRECTHKKNVKDADRLYRFIVGNGLQCYSFWADHIIPLFGFSGTLQQAVQAFHRVVHPTVQTWRAIIALHIKFAKSSMVLSLYDLMLTNAVAPDRVTYLHAIQACGLESALSSGMRIHNHVIEDGYDSNSSVANTLIDMYSKCGQMDEACCVFNHLSSKSVVSWGALIGGYSKKGQCHKVFELVIKMQQNKVKINNIIISCILKSCNTPESLAEGRLTHILAINGGVESDSLATRALINMYISCNSLQDAQSVFDSTKQIDMKSWGTMTAGYAQSGLGDAACQLFQEMQQNGHQLDRVILLCMVQACQSTESSKEGRLIHQRILKEGFETYIHLGNALIDMHVVRGSLEDAQNVFDRLVTKDVISWAAIISGYVQHDCSEVALSLFDSMQESHIEPDILIYLWVLKACAKLRSLGPGISLHNDILYKGFESDISVCGSLIDMYSGCGSLEEALFLFNSVSDPSIVLWGAMISGCVQHGHDLLALDLFKRMQRQGLQPDTALSTSLLKACSRTGSIEEGRILHRNLDRHELKLNTTLANCIIDMYSKCGSIAEAHETFESLPTRGVSCWSTMIIAYIEANLIHPAFDLIDKMLEEGISPDKTLFLHLCKTCGQIKATGWANLVFDLLIRAGLDSCSVVGSSLIDMYARCACLMEAESVLNKLPNIDIVCWGALLTGYIHCGYALPVLDLFKETADAGVEADRAVFLSVLKACGAMMFLEEGRILHSYIIECSLEADVMIISTLIDMYCKCGTFVEGQSLLSKSQCSNEVSCGAMISGYVSYGCGIPAFDLFKAMQKEDLDIGKPILLCILKACRDIGAMDQGRIIHNQVISSNFETDLLVGNTLIDMYSKCGSPKDAYKVFEGLSERDIVSWSIIICAYASQGDWESTFYMLKAMQSHGMQPDDPLFISVLSACSQNGLLNEGCRKFGQMEGEYSLSPRIDHFNCMVDVLGRGGNLSEAEDMLRTMPSAPNSVSWLSMLTGCRLYGNKKLNGSVDKGEQVELDLFPSRLKPWKFCPNSDQFLKVHETVNQSQCVRRTWPQEDYCVYNCEIGISYNKSGDMCANFEGSMLTLGEKKSME